MPRMHKGGPRANDQVRAYSLLIQGGGNADRHREGSHAEPRVSRVTDGRTYRKAILMTTHSPAHRKSQANDLVALAAGAELFHTPDSEAYAAIDLGSHREVGRLKEGNSGAGWQKNFTIRTTGFQPHWP